VGTIIVSGKLGPKRKSEINPKNFECGGIGNARIPFSVKYFLDFVLLFDVEVIFLSLGSILKN
jgi:NADH-quinone oxidoreductase subunit A